jgi:predicted nucleotidyltransferase
MFDKVVNIINAKYSNVEKIYIYGSYARGKQTDSSDLDVCVKMPNGTSVMRMDEDLNNELTSATGIDVHVVFCTIYNQWCEKLIYDNI